MIRFLLVAAHHVFAPGHISCVHGAGMSELRKQANGLGDLGQLAAFGQTLRGVSKQWARRFSLPGRMTELDGIGGHHGELAALGPGAGGGGAGNLV